ncbi:multidrug efflux MFS transporter (plasmid) [Paenibacillus rhizovicinus]|uniref:Multidrug efflux MFS transporter n=1 Tax=Paenibacillus rhizovicinus TaxID=2704463 RepID=A0A6C0PCL9_9BACL|nr:MDR family MFS transporter [Paenibacillus rhizovicinus]QHW34832.1 multidrug efflux MFS transporter [Paenibacillus rhizovicinus]QHW35592.1 multidrug efflux MFS transporter [Paenibacillus rhizovicinus]
MEKTKPYNTRAIMFSLLMCSFIGMFSETSLNIALSNLMHVFQISAATAQWLTTVYLLVLGILMPMSGLLLQRFTTKQLFTASLISLIVGTFAAAISVNFEMLLAARVLQAFGMGLLLPLMFHTILLIYPTERRGAAMGLVGLVIMCAPTTGPTIAGILIQYLSWHYIFWLSLPFLIIGLFVGLKNLENITEVSKPRFDLASIIMSTIGFGGIVYGFSKAGEDTGGWTHPAVIASVAVGLVALVLFIVRQIRMRDPLLNMGVFKHPMYVMSVVMVVSSMLMAMSLAIILPLFLQNGKGLTTLTTGLMLLPGSLLNGILSNRMGQLFDKFGPRRLVIPGLVIAAVTLWFFTNISLASTVAFIITLHMVMMIGLAMIWVPAQTNGLNQLPPHLYAHGTAVMNTVQQVTGAIATAVSISILSSGTERYLRHSTAPSQPAEIANAMATGSEHVFWFTLIVAVVGLVVSLFIRRVVINHAVEAKPTH